ncbi:MAG TPA: prolyl oligopeptidase family serine peptidase [Anaerolineaceae bacterium]|nr:prolyl oligopeptidase family serine peptidase [Anaerolineaceae bacterium]
MPREVQIENNAPWKQRYTAPSIGAAQIASLCPTKGILNDTRSGTLQWYAWDIPSNALRQITDTPGGFSSDLTISPDGQWVYYLDDAQGNEIGHYVRRLIDGGDLQDITPDLPLYSSYGFSISRCGNRIGFMAVYENGFHIYCVDIEKDEKLSDLREIYTSSQYLDGIFLSSDGNVLFTRSTERTGKPQFSLLAFDAAMGEKIAELWDGEENSLDMMVTSPMPGDARILATTTRTGIESLLIWNPCSGERTDLTFENVTGAIRAFDWSADGCRILFRTFNSAIQQLYLHDLSTGETIQLRYPAGVNSSPCFAPNNTEIFSRWENSTQPSCLIALSTRTGEMLRTVISAGEVPPGHELKSVIFSSSDGQTIQGWLGIPDGEGPFPTVIEIHGGPETVVGNTFSPNAQSWLDHGFAYIAVNYRGSRTFGREFEQKIWNQPGYWEIEDLVAARAWLVQQNIAKAGAILLTGWSYGGYLTLLGLGKTPELWAGGMAGMAATDWAMSYEDAAETIKGYLVSLFGGTPAEKPEQYRISSAITYAENVIAPVLIVQGRNDTIAPPRPVQEYENKMRSLGKDIEVHWYDTGHAGSFSSVEEGIRHQELFLRFAFRLLG